MQRFSSFDPAPLLRSQLAQYLPKMLLRLLMACPAAPLGDKHHVIFSLPLSGLGPYTRPS